MLISSVVPTILLSESSHVRVYGGGTKGVNFMHSLEADQLELFLPITAKAIVPLLFSMPIVWAPPSEGIFNVWISITFVLSYNNICAVIKLPPP